MYISEDSTPHTVHLTQYTSHSTPRPQTYNTAHTSLSVLLLLTAFPPSVIAITTAGSKKKGFRPYECELWQVTEMSCRDYFSSFEETQKQPYILYTVHTHDTHKTRTHTHTINAQMPCLIKNINTPPTTFDTHHMRSQLLNYVQCNWTYLFELHGHVVQCIPGHALTCKSTIHICGGAFSSKGLGHCQCGCEVVC